MPLNFTLTAASTALNIATTTAVQPVPLKIGTNTVTGGRDLGDQIASIDVTSTSSTETGTLVMFLYDPATAKKMRVVEYTLAVPSNAYRDSSDGASGNYVCTVSNKVDLTNKIDFLGKDDFSRTVNSAGAAQS